MNINRRSLKLAAYWSLLACCGCARQPTISAETSLIDGRQLSQLAAPGDSAILILLRPEDIYACRAALAEEVARSRSGIDSVVFLTIRPPTPDELLRLKKVGIHPAGSLKLGQMSPRELVTPIRLVLSGDAILARSTLTVD